MIYNVVIEGQSISLPEEIGKTDEGVRRALQAYYPDVAHALISRTTSGETVTISVVKKAGTKGAPFVDLPNLPEGRNQAIELYEELSALRAAGTLGADVLTLRSQEIETTIKAGEADDNLMTAAAKRLARSRPLPAPYLPQGF